MNALPVALLLLVENSIFVLGKHFLLTRHLCIPSLNSLCAVTIPCKCSADGIDDTVHGTKALALPGLLRRGQTPWGLPENRNNWLVVFLVYKLPRKTHQRRPPSKEGVGLNIVGQIRGESLDHRNRKIMGEVGVSIGPCVRGASF